jgi:hypothetical protein
MLGSTSTSMAFFDEPAKCSGVGPCSNVSRLVNGELQKC